MSANPGDDPAPSKEDLKRSYEEAIVGIDNWTLGVIESDAPLPPSLAEQIQIVKARAIWDNLQEAYGNEILPTTVLGNSTKVWCDDIGAL